MANWKKLLEKTNKELEPFGIILDVEYSASDRCYKIWHTEKGIEFVQGNLSKEELIEFIPVSAYDLIADSIHQLSDVRRFFEYLVDKKSLCFHPDDDFKDYICYETKERTFTDGEAESLNRAMDFCFDVCAQNNADIYEIASYIILPF